MDWQVIPRGTIVGINLYALNHNENYFPDPFVFRPKRRLPADTTDTPESSSSRKLMYEAFALFSVGPRGCAGKAMAYLEVSLIVAKSLWHFDLKAASGKLGEIGEVMLARLTGNGDQSSTNFTTSSRVDMKGRTWSFLRAEICAAS